MARAGGWEPSDDHAETVPAPARPGAGGELNAAVARAVVRIYRNVAGRGPTRAHAFFRDSVIVVVLENVMTKAELSIAEAGQHAAVEQVRAALPQAMRSALVAAIERLTGAKVRAVMSSSDVRADMACEVFVLDRQVAR